MTGPVRVMLALSFREQPAEETGEHLMPSIYQRALGSDFEKLHPKIQQPFGLRPFSCPAIQESQGIDKSPYSRLPAGSRSETGRL